MARTRVVTVPDPEFTRNLLLHTAWLTLLYMLLLTLFEFIELVRPKPPPTAQIDNAQTAPPPSPPSSPSPETSEKLCPRCRALGARCLNINQNQRRQPLCRIL
ncbi:hypothetical protein HF086_013697 [Spodoptera exigua]|uniref:Uncharacterized protein n=1 Tax=Spodoptera exigua TaxID=7107 RepID=A0A922MKT4_SPOEX|nr:hypothetical protein HF086_013697 [Spodoptera exigua]